MAGRESPAARLRELMEKRRLERQREQEASSNNNTAPTGAGDGNQNSGVKDLPPKVKGIGRAQLIANLKKKREEKIGLSGDGLTKPPESISANSPNSAGPPVSATPSASAMPPTSHAPPLTGRAALLAKIAARNKAKEAEKERAKQQALETGEEVAPSGSAVIEALSGNSEGLDELNRKFEQMKVEEEAGPVRKTGSKGREFTASANIIKLHLKKSYGIYEYHVKFHPPTDNIKDKKSIVRQLTDTIGEVRTFDGSTLCLPVMLEKPKYVLDAKSLSGECVAVTLTVKRRRDLKECEQLFNVLFNKIFEILKMVEIKRNHYDPSARMMVPAHKLEIWPGYVNRVKECDGGLMLICDASHKLLRQETAYSMMQDVRKKSQSNFKENLEKILIGSVVMTEYNKYTTYRVDDIDFDQTPRSKFTTHSGAQISYQEYYKKYYNIDIKDVNQPMLVHRMRKKEAKDIMVDKVILLVPELCRMTGLTDTMRADFRVMKDVALHTRISPDTRQTALKKFIKNVSDNEECTKLLDQWGLQLEKEPIRMKARTLDNEKLLVGKGRTVLVNSKANWSRESTNNECLVAVDLKNWHVVCAERNKTETEGFIKLMKRLAPKMGINVDEPSLSVLANDRTETFIKDLHGKTSKNLQLVVAVVPMQREDRYAALKKLCNTELAIPSQVICSRTISNDKKVQSVVQNVALQINCKLGGELWGASIPLKNLMVVGLDVYHDPTRKRPSVLSAVASMNRTISAWQSESEFQKPGQELADVMMAVIGKLVGLYEKKNKVKPEQIIVYRDGVGDGQIEHVTPIEADRCEAFFKCANFEPQFAYIVVQKRINRKLFCCSGDKYDNPPPGSVIDHTIMKKSFNDFLLVSQHVSQGVVNPTHYIIVKDTTTFTTDQIQKLTYKLTHMYYNWPGTVRVPAPCQYAHKLAYQIGEVTKVQPSPVLSDRLFFL